MKLFYSIHSLITVHKSDEEDIYRKPINAQVQIYTTYLIAPMNIHLPVCNSDKQKEYKTTTKIGGGVKSASCNRPWRPRGEVHVELYSFFNLCIVVLCTGCLTLANRPSYYCTGGWVVYRASLDGYRKSCPPNGIQFQDCSAHNESLY